MVKVSRFDGPLAQAQAVLGWATLAVVLLAAIPAGGNRPIAWTLLAFAILGLFLGQILLSAVRPAAVALSRAMWPALLYGLVVAWGVVQVLLPVPDAAAHPVWSLVPDGAPARIGADPGAGAHIAMRLATYAMIAWILAASALNSLRAWGFLRAVGIFSALMAIYAIWAMVNGANPVLGDGFIVPGYTTGTFVNRNSYAFYAAMGLFANVAVYLQLSQRGALEGGHVFAGLRDYLENFFRGAWLYAGGALLCGAALVLTQSRAGAAAALLGVLVFAICMLRRQRVGQGAVWLVMFGLLAYAGYSFGAGTLERLMSLDGASGRFEIYARILPVILDRPLLGHGAGAFHDTFRAHVPVGLAQAEWDYAHNTYLENAYEFGLPAAALLYLALGLVALRCVIGLRVRDADTAIPAMTLAVLATGAAHSALDFPLQMPGAAALFAVLLGIGWAQSFSKDDRRSLPRTEVTNDI